MNLRVFPRFATSIVAILFGLAIFAQAGPPLICHPIDIGQRKSLPWISHSWNLTGNETYDLRNLTRDTLAILDSSVPVLVRMETLRRATLYARQDPRVAKELLTRLHARATDSEAAGQLDPLAWFDVGYLAETYKQWMDKDRANAAAGLDGYGWVKKAISARGNDPEMEFAAALISLEGPEGDHRDHVRKAMAGAKRDPLLAQNLAAHFMGNPTQTMSEVLARSGGGFKQ
jgi:hypothetical protein